MRAPAIAAPRGALRCCLAVATSTFAVFGLAASAALGATLAVDRPCVNSLQQYAVVGAGFVPGTIVTVRPVQSRLDFERFTADAAGNFAGPMRAPRADPSNPLKEQPIELHASDRAGTVLATSGILLAKPSVSLLPRVFDTRRRVKFAVRGFTRGQPVYAHLRAAGRWVRTSRLGVAGGECGELVAREALFRGLRFKKTLAQVYVQVDQNPTPSIIQTPSGYKRLFIRRPIGYAYYRWKAEVYAGGFHDAVVQ